jgi:hypothetical protein
MPFIRLSKPISSAKPAHFDFSSSNGSVQGHVLTIAGDAESIMGLQPQKKNGQNSSKLVTKTLVTNFQ